MHDNEEKVRKKEKKIVLNENGENLHRESDKKVCVGGKLQRSLLYAF